MNTYVILACVLAVAGLSQGSAIGLGSYGLGGYGLGGYGLGGYGLGGHGGIISAPILAPAAISTANLVKAAPISVPIVKTIPVPISVPIVKSVPVSVGWNGLGGWGGLGWGGLGWGGKGVSSGVWGGNPWGGYGWGKY